MREQMIVLTLVPRAVSEEPVLEMEHDAAPAEQGALHNLIATEQAICRDQRGSVPHLPIRSAFVVLRNDRRTGLDEPIADAGAGRCELRSRRLEEIGGNAQIQKPDRLEVCAEEESRRPQDIVTVRIEQVLIDIAVEDRRRERRRAVIAPKARQQRTL